ncbi:MAG: hypothetical protein QMC68_08630 [Bacteroidia bacterium]
MKILYLLLVGLLILSSCCDECPSFPTGEIIQLDTTEQSGFSFQEIQSAVQIRFNTDTSIDTLPLSLNTSTSSHFYGRISLFELGLNENSTHLKNELWIGDSQIATLKNPQFDITLGRGVCSCDNVCLLAITINDTVRQVANLPLAIRKK